MDRTPYRRDMLEQHAEQVKQLLERLNEQQRRHVGGLLALLLGRGGDSFVAKQFAVNRRTVRKGKKELLDGFKDVPGDRLRKPGGGRPALEKKVHKSKKRSKKSSPPTPEDCRPENENGRD